MSFKLYFAYNNSLSFRGNCYF